MGPPLTPRGVCLPVVSHQHAPVRTPPPPLSRTPAFTHTPALAPGDWCAGPARVEAAPASHRPDVPLEEKRTLRVFNVPVQHLNIMKLSSHFSKFGNVVNVKVGPGHLCCLTLTLTLTLAPAFCRMKHVLWNGTRKALDPLCALALVPPVPQVFPDKFYAFVQFDKHLEALAAKRSPQSVLGNRFIKVAWARHDPDDPEDCDPDAVGGAAAT